MKSRFPVLYLMATLVFALLLLSGCLATPIETIDASLLGTWRGDATVRLPIRFAPPPDEEREPDVTIPLAITLHDDARVTGTVGGAELADCVLKRNRGELGRRLNFATDYIVMDGYLAGPVVPGDEELHKDLTIPFNVADGRMRGSVMWLQDWKYPSPLMEVDLVKDER